MVPQQFIRPQRMMLTRLVEKSEPSQFEQVQVETSLRTDILFTCHVSNDACSKLTAEFLQESV